MAYTPQHNGVFQRKNITVMEMATFMLQEKNLKKILWAKVVNTTVYLLNKSSTKVVPNQTSIEAWSSRKP